MKLSLSGRPALNCDPTFLPSLFLFLLLSSSGVTSRGRTPSAERKRREGGREG